MSAAPSATQASEAYKRFLGQLERDTNRAFRTALALGADLGAQLPPEPWLSEQLDSERPFVVTALWAGNDELTYALAQVLALARQGRSISTEAPWGVPADREAIWQELRSAAPKRKKSPHGGGRSGGKRSSRSKPARKPRPKPQPKPRGRRPRGARLPLVALPTLALTSLAESVSA